MKKPFHILLSNGWKDTGFGFGNTKCGLVQGEFIFNTSMVGYQEVLTDPSYNQQIVVMTFPMQGIYGINENDHESHKIEISAMIINNYQENVKYSDKFISLAEFLKLHQILGVENIDTRQLTKVIRHHGSLNGAIYDPSKYTEKEIAQKIQEKTFDKHVEKLQRNTEKKYFVENAKYHFALYDLGSKQNIIRELNQNQINVTLVGLNYPCEDILKWKNKVDAVFLSNGPGDPNELTNMISQVQTIMQHKVPVLGICLGFQIIALALKCEILKMYFGHHGINHAVRDIETNKIIITSQNHNYFVNDKTLPSTVKPIFYSVNAPVLQGLKDDVNRCYAIQFHPESHPGPNDANYIFQNMIKFVQKYENN